MKNANMNENQQPALHIYNTSYITRQARDRDWYDAKYQKEDFGRHKIGDPAFVRALISKLSIRQGFHLLDLGCGIGWYSYLFATNGLKITGVDISKVGIRKAKELHGAKINWIVGDACNLQFVEDFDVVFCSGFSPLTMVESLESPDAKEIGKKLFGYLKNKGLFIFLWNSDLTKKTRNYWAHYSPTQIENYFLNLPYNEILGLYTTHPQLFPIFGKYALSKAVTLLTLLGLKFHRKNVRIVCVLRKLAPI